jgi:hypothetical protein
MHEISNNILKRDNMWILKILQYIFFGLNISFSFVKHNSLVSPKK